MHAFPSPSKNEFMIFKSPLSHDPRGGAVAATARQCPVQATQALVVCNFSITSQSKGPALRILNRIFHLYFKTEIRTWR